MKMIRSFTTADLTNSTFDEITPINHIVSVRSSESVNDLLGLDVALVEIDATLNAAYQQAFYSLLTHTQSKKV